MIKKFGMHKTIFNDILEDSDIGIIDESSFITWKRELLKELPSFWDSINELKNDYDQDDIVSHSKVLKYFFDF